jgi:hypothetical protein
MTYISRIDPNISCENILMESEWKQHGGFKGRKGDGNPGMISFWRGWNRVLIGAEMYELMA